MPARERKATPQEPSPSGVLTGWARQGVQSFVAAQKILMDLAAQENALLIGMVREGLSKPGARLGASVADIAEKSIENLTTAGKILLDLAADETALAVDGLKEGLQLPQAAEAVADVAQHRVHTLIEMHKHLLDATADQAHAMADSYRENGKFAAASHVTELARRGIEGFVESEKKFLDLATHEVTNATKGDKHGHKPPRRRIEILTEVARESAGKCLDTQKKLFDLAIEQLEETVKTGREPRKPLRKEERPLLGDLADKSMKNFVAAEKSLLDLAMKPLAAGDSGRKPGKRRQKTSAEKKHEAAAAKSTVAAG
jgi:hypothetical protein